MSTGNSANRGGFLSTTFTGLYRAKSLIAIYRAADVALVTSFKGRHDLVAKEYCSVRTEANGVLVLSE